MNKKILLPLSFIALAIPLALNQSYVSNNALYVSDYISRDDFFNHALDVNEQIGNEGIVLLKNDGFLPFKNVKKISIVGKTSSNLTYSPYGRAAGSSFLDAKFVSLKQAFVDGGFLLNEELEQFYGDNSRSGRGRTNGNDGWRGNSQVQIAETPLSKYSSDLLASMDNYKDAAIMVINR